jgi:diguanylate cyclase (GGDEF)-like protein
VGALLAQWREGLRRGDAGGDGPAGPWPSGVLAGRAAAVLFWLCGVSSLVGLVWPTLAGDQPGLAYVAAAVAIGAGVLTWFLPWNRWPRWAGLVLVPVGLALVALQIALASPDIRLHGVLFVLLFAWIGVVFPRGTALLALPLFAAAYLLPLVSLGQFSALTVASAVFVGLACVLAGELLAWLSARLQLSQVALWRARAAVNDIGAELASTADPEELWSSIALRLSDVAGLPDCDVYRLTDDGRLVCLASVYDDGPCPDYLGLRPEQDVWAVDGKAVLSREPVLIASPADPRLGAAEREDMCAWREQAMLVVPLVARGETIGLVEISETREGHTITPEQVSTVVSVCRLVAMALHDADTMHAQEESERRLASMHESSRAVAGAASLEEALAVVTRCAGEALGVSECVAYEHDVELEAIVMRARWERTPGGRDRSGEPLPLAEDPMGHTVLESGRSLLECFSDPKLDPAIRADLDSRGEKTRLTVPMPSADGPVGLLTFGDSERERVFPDEDLAAANALAGLAGEAVAGARLLRRLGRLSEADAMTGLASHRELHESLALEQARAEHKRSHFSAVMLGLDGLKSLNDAYGHSAGDEVLRRVAAMLSERTGDDDVVGRWAGDEFLVILAETTAVQAALFAEELCAALAETSYVTEAGELIPIRIGFGIATYPEDASDANGLVALADAALRASKHPGGDAEGGDELLSGPCDAEAEAASASPVEAGAPLITAARRDRTGKSAAGETAASTDSPLWDGDTIDQAEMRSRIEATRTRLKVKAFDAMIRGEGALLGRDGDEGSAPLCDDPVLDGDLDCLVEGALSEEEY